MCIHTFFTTQFVVRDDREGGFTRLGRVRAKSYLFSFEKKVLHYIGSMCFGEEKKKPAGKRDRVTATLQKSGHVVHGEREKKNWRTATLRTEMLRCNIFFFLFFL